MEFTTLAPHIFYTDISVGLKLFVSCLGFNMHYDGLEDEEPFCVIEKNGIKAYLKQDEEFALKDRPELHLETRDIDAVYSNVRGNYPELLHPNLNEVTLQPWNAREFALRDESGVCIIVQQWPS